MDAKGSRYPVPARALGRFLDFQPLLLATILGVGALALSRPIAERPLQSRHWSAQELGVGAAPPRSLRIRMRESCTRVQKIGTADARLARNSRF
jgi:hypothetical protein